MHRQRIARIDSWQSMTTEWIPSSSTLLDEWATDSRKPPVASKSCILESHGASRDNVQMRCFPISKAVEQKAGWASAGSE